MCKPVTLTIKITSRGIYKRAKTTTKENSRSKTHTHTQARAHTDIYTLFKMLLIIRYITEVYDGKVEKKAL